MQKVFLLLSLSATLLFSNFDTTTKEANTLMKTNKKQAYKKYKQAYAEATDRSELIRTFAALAVTAMKLKYNDEAGSYADRLRTIDPSSQWVDKFRKDNKIKTPKQIKLINGETHLEQMRLGDNAYKQRKYDEAYINYLRGLSTCIELKELIVSLASLTVASYDSGREDESKIYLERLLKVSPNNQWATNYKYKNYREKDTNYIRQSYSSISKNCTEPAPLLACSPSKEKAVSIAMCAVVMGGCKAIKKNMDKGERYIADQSCTIISNKLVGEKNTLDSVLSTAIGTTLSDVAQDARDSNDDGLLQLLFATSLTIADMGYKAVQFNNCQKAAQKTCRAIYNKWKYNCH